MCREMTDTEFVRLQMNLASKYAEIEKLQKKYWNQTGRRYIPGQGVKVGSTFDYEDVGICDDSQQAEYCPLRQ